MVFLSARQFTFIHFYLFTFIKNSHCVPSSVLDMRTMKGSNWLNHVYKLSQRLEIAVRLEQAQRDRKG